jgi:hypothetical protein
MKMAVLWVVAPCSLVEFERRFRGAHCLHHQGEVSEVLVASIVALIMEAASISQTSENFYQTTLRNNPDDSHLYKLLH